MGGDCLVPVLVPLGRNSKEIKNLRASRGLRLRLFGQFLEIMVFCCF